MSHVEGFPDKDGIDKLVKLGKAMCNTVTLFTPILLRKYPDSTLIPLLLAAIQGVCALLPEVENEFLGNEGDNSEILEDPASAAGIDPSLPPAGDPDIT